MLYWLADYLSQHFSAFNVFKYLTLRAILGVMTSLFISLLAGPAVIRRLQSMQIGQAIRDDGPQSHLVKAGTPTMGGALILLSIFYQHPAVVRSEQSLCLGGAGGDAGVRRGGLGG